MGFKKFLIIAAARGAHAALLLAGVVGSESQRARLNNPTRPSVHRMLQTS